jgi:hypothetical protein
MSPNNPKQKQIRRRNRRDDLRLWAQKETLDPRRPSGRFWLPKAVEAIKLHLDRFLTCDVGEPGAGQPF